MLLGGAIHGGVTLLGELRDLFLQPGNLLPLRVPVVQCPRDRIRSLHRSRDRVRVGGYEYPLPRQQPGFILSLFQGVRSASDREQLPQFRLCPLSRLLRLSGGVCCLLTGFLLLRPQFVSGRLQAGQLVPDSLRSAEQFRPAALL